MTKMKTTRYNISNEKTIYELLPWYLRGKKIQAFLLGVSEPLAEMHLPFLSWARERIIEASIDSRKLPIQWLLKHKLGEYLQDDSKEYEVYTTDHKHYSLVLWNKGETGEAARLQGSYLFASMQEIADLKAEDNAAYICNLSEGDCHYTRFVIVSPLFDSSKIDQDSYERLIRSWVDRYTLFQFQYIVELIDN